MKNFVMQTVTPMTTGHKQFGRAAVLFNIIEQPGQVGAWIQSKKKGGSKQSPKNKKSPQKRKG